MGKGKGKGKAVAVVEQAPAVAERHEFSGGLLGHESTYVINVSEQVALAIPTVYNCVRIIADLISDANVGEFRGTELLPVPSRLVRRPMQTMFRRQWLWLTVACMALYNGVWWRRIGGRDSDGVALSLVPYSPTRMAYDGQDWRLDGEVIDRNDFVYIPRTSFPTVAGDAAFVLRLARDAFAAAWAAQSYSADWWQAGGAPVIYIKTDQALSNTQAEELRDNYATARADNPGKPAVMGRGGELKTLGADASATGTGEAAQQLGRDIAQFFGVPAWLANVPAAAGSLVYQNSSSAGLDLVRYTLRPGYSGIIGDAWSEEIPGDPLMGRRVVLDLKHLTEGTILEQFQAYQIATGGKAWMLPSEVRNNLHMPIDMTLDEQGAPAPAVESIPNG